MFVHRRYQGKGLIEGKKINRYIYIRLNRLFFHFCLYIYTHDGHVQFGYDQISKEFFAENELVRLNRLLWLNSADTSASSCSCTGLWASKGTRLAHYYMDRYRNYLPHAHA